MVYVAHIVTSDAGVGATPEVAVTIADVRTGVSEPVISYPLARPARVADAVEVLHCQGWALHGTRRYMEPGYWLAQLQVTDWAAIMRAVSAARQSVEIERQCLESAWRTILDDALHDEHTAPGVIEDMAGIAPTHAHPHAGSVTGDTGTASAPFRIALP